MGPEPQSRRRVVEITPYYHPVVGGITTYLAGLAEELASRGAEVFVLTREGDEGPRVLRGPSRTSEFIRWCRERLRELQPDAVHGHGHWYCLAGALKRGGPPIARPLLFTVHTFPAVRSRIRSAAFRRMLGRVDAITFVSQGAQKKFVEAFGSPSKMEVVYPGVRSFPAASRTLRSHASTGASFRMCAVSLMSWPEKVEGLRILLQAVALLSKQIPGISLVIVGDGEGRRDLENFAEALGIGGKVRFTGRLSDPSPVLAESDVLCHVSFKESFAQVVLEAMSLGIPVVLNEGVMDDPLLMGPRGGIVWSSADPDSLSRTLADLASNPEARRRLGAAGKELVLKYFSWTRHADRFWTLYGFE